MGYYGGGFVERQVAKAAFGYEKSGDIGKQTRDGNRVLRLGEVAEI